MDIDEESKKYCLYFDHGKCNAKACNWKRYKDEKPICSCGGYLGDMEVRR